VTGAYRLEVDGASQFPSKDTDPCPTDKESGMPTYTTKTKIMVYLTDEDKQKVEELTEWMDSDSMTETMRRLIRKEHREWIEKRKQKENKK
jgi:hypothetical protein